ncbi:hypothetical protein VC83_02826 [Pseudogymnoascus destructans]|uniref:Sulfotransferase domain-containing protein n=2 Tax=Pseudogymnoascus destructans TaxID=655981 RepID=L8FWS9_PSED2|nr:uncharacterized protein VC83_02826 [Pseudogymnoascus destructans]ELR04938.1 hypothetical protein GMDG_00196 [Pseudogymnoascus destructans 20631-21]OAF60297.1 hypothetical protein VC83_02826 [Pseudogymnoascus destructans]
MTITPPQGRKPAFILSHPRTASNLFMKIFKSHPDVVPAEYPFLDVFFFGIESQCSRKSPEIEAARTAFQEKTGVSRSYHEAFKKLEDDIRKASEQDKVAFVKEHICVFLKPSVIDSNLEAPRPPCATPQLEPNDAEVRISTNPTLLPDDFMLSVSPVFLIRHPALVFPSWYKISTSGLGADIDDSDFPVEVSFRWSRILYDWYLNTWSKTTSSSPLNQHRKPAVIDADDTMSDRAALERLCHQFQLDPRQLSFEWQAAKTELVPWFSTIQKSTGVDMSKISKDIDIQQEFVKWEDEFGSHVAQKLLRFVELAMPDYEYLLSKRGG